MANRPAGRGQYVVTFSFNAGNGEGGRIASQRLVDVSWTLKLRNVVLVKRVAVEKGQQESPPFTREIFLGGVADAQANCPSVILVKPSMKRPKLMDGGLSEP